MTKKLLGTQPVLNTAVVIVLMSKQGDYGHHWRVTKLLAEQAEALCVSSVLARLNHDVRLESANVSGSLGVVAFPRLDSSFLWKKRWPCMDVC